MDSPTADEIDAIYDALERGEPEQALAIARRGLGPDPRDPVLSFLAGTALLELDRPAEAVPLLEGAVDADPDDVEFRTVLARALFHGGRTEEAHDHARHALEIDPDSAEAHEVMALALEAAARFEESDRHFRRAGELDPQAFPPPLRLSAREFEQVVREAGERLPGRFRERLDEVAVSVESVPSLELREAESPALDPGLLGLFVGVALPDRSFLSPGGELPPRIYLFQRNLERWAGSRESLREEIAVTLYHELGHYLGLDEEELEQIDLG